MTHHITIAHKDVVGGGAFLISSNGAFTHRSLCVETGVVVLPVMKTKQRSMESTRDRLVKIHRLLVSTKLQPLTNPVEQPRVQ